MFLFTSTQQLRNLDENNSDYYTMNQFLIDNVIWPYSNAIAKNNIKLLYSINDAHLT